MSQNKGNFLFNVKAVSKVFRAKFVANLRKKCKGLPKSLYESLFKKDWVIYAKKAFAKPAYVIEYLGRYSHKIAISNHRILDINNQNNTITFSLKNYKKDGQKETQILHQKEFIRRFALHILPKGFTRIRRYGIMSGTWKKKNLKALQEQLNGSIKITKKKEDIKSKHLQCPSCGKGKLHTIFMFTRTRPPPEDLLEQIRNQQYNKSVNDR